MSATVSVPPDLARLAIRHGDTLPFRLWLLCRHLDTAGQGWIMVASIPLEHLGITARQLHNTIQAGDGVWWTFTERRLFYASLPRLALRFGCDGRHNRPVSIPLEVLRRLAAFRACCYAAWLELAEISGETNPISRLTLGELWGADKRTLRRWEKRAGIRARANYRFVPMANRDRLPDVPGREVHCSCGRFWCRDGDTAKIMAHKALLCGGQLIVTAQRPNSYRVEGLERGAWGKVGRRNRRKYKRLLHTGSDVTKAGVSLSAGHCRNLRDKAHAHRTSNHEQDTSVYLASQITDPLPGYLIERGAWWVQLW